MVFQSHIQNIGVASPHVLKPLHNRKTFTQKSKLKSIQMQRISQGRLNTNVTNICTTKHNINKINIATLPINPFCTA